MRVQGAKSVEGGVCPNFHLWLSLHTLRKIVALGCKPGTKDRGEGTESCSVPLDTALQQEAPRLIRTGAFLRIRSKAPHPVCLPSPQVEGTARVLGWLMLVPLAHPK